jgi:hypothetical protein
MANWWESAPVVEEKSTASSTPDWLKNVPVVEQEPRSVTITPDRQRAAPIGEGERQAVADKALVDKRGGTATEAGFMAGANMALFNIPSHVAAAYRAKKEGRPYEQVYKEQKEYEAALNRQFPTASTVGDVAGFGAGMFVPLGPLAKVGQAAGYVGSKIGPTAGRVAEIAGISGAASGASSLIEQGKVDKDSVQEALKSAGIGTAAGAGLGVAGQKFSNWLSRKPDAFVDGKPTPETIQAFKSAFGDKLSPQDLDLASERVMGILGQKGPSKASMYEALAAEEGLPKSRALVTGTRPSEAAAPYAEKARVGAEEKLRESLSGIIGKEQPGVSIPGAIKSAAEEAEAKAADLLNAAKKAQGEFVPGKRWVEKPLAEGEAARAKPLYTQQEYNLGNLVNENVRKTLSQSEIGFPTNFASEPGYQKAADAQRYLFNTFAGDTPPIGGSQWDLRNIMHVNEQLNSFWKGATNAKERAAIGAMKIGYENAVNEAVTQKLFTGDGAEALKLWKQGREDWAKYKKTFFPERVVEARAFNEIISSMYDTNGRLAETLNPALEKAANAALNGGAISPKFGEALLDRLEKVVGKDTDTMKAIYQNLRQKMLTPTNGELKNVPSAIDKFLSPDNLPLAKRILAQEGDKTPEQQISQLRRIKTLVEKLNASSMPDEQKHSFFLRALRGVPTLVGAALGYPHGIIATGAAALAGKSLGDIGEGLAKSAQIGAEQFGAPVFKQPFEVPSVRIPGAPEFLQPKFMPSVRNVETVEDPANYQLPPMVPDRPGRAAGGKVMNAEAHADRLVAMAERAKNKHSESTKPLLNAPDEHIAKALEIANRHI